MSEILKPYLKRVQESGVEPTNLNFYTFMIMDAYRNGDRRALRELKEVVHSLRLEIEYPPPKVGGFTKILLGRRIEETAEEVAKLEKLEEIRALERFKRRAIEMINYALKNLE